MTRYNPQNWYWRVGGDDSRAWSSAAAGFVQVSDATFRAWVEAGGTPTNIPNMDELRGVLADAYPGGSLETYAASKRWQREVGGFVFNGIQVATDDRSQTKILGVRMAADADPAYTTPWAVGVEVYQLNAAEIIAISNAARQHVQDCFTTYATVIAGITDGSITTRAQIDAAFAA